MENKPSPKQLKLARELGVSDVETMSAKKVHIAISTAPATQEQLKFAHDLLTFLKHELPTRLTYSEAKRLLDDVAPHVNERVLMDEKWEEGDILQWRDSYVLIETIHPNKCFTLVRVELRREAPDKPLGVTRTQEAKRVRHPFTLHGEATKVNPKTCQP